MRKHRTYATLIYRLKKYVAYITLHRPDFDNSINQQLAAELAEVCQDINFRDDIRAVVISGAGDRAFSSGTSPELEAQPPPQVAASVASLYPPVIAAINGDALGQGLELALGCDIRISAETAHFGLPQVAQGLIPMDGGSQRLPRLIGQARALELLLTAKTIDAREALDLGLVDKVVPQDRLRPEVEALATRLAAKSPIALRYAKEAVIKGMDLTLDQGLRLEADLYFLLHTTRDRSEGVRAFLEKRQARFKGK
ncbi:MAG TPA: hypothetical protein G4O03_04965 [Dehalococcoidia bacterium]|nr:hypothetical protein [Dehalococcoidia bacterium]